LAAFASYERAAELLDSLPESIEELAADRKKLLALPGIGDGMADHIQEILKTGDYSLRAKLLKRISTRLLLDRLTLQSLGQESGFSLENFCAQRIVARLEDFLDVVGHAIANARQRQQFLAVGGEFFNRFRQAVEQFALVRSCESGPIIAPSISSSCAVSRNTRATSRFSISVLEFVAPAFGGHFTEINRSALKKKADNSKRFCGAASTSPRIYANISGATIRRIGFNHKARRGRLQLPPSDLFVRHGPL